MPHQLCVLLLQQSASTFVFQFRTFCRAPSRAFRFAGRPRPWYIRPIIMPPLACRPMKLVLLGTGGYFPTTRRHTACFMLPEVGVVLDAGTGMCRLGEHLQTDRLDIFLTHAHLDHIAGLTYLINVVPRTCSKHVVHGDAAKLAAVREHLFAEAIFPVPPPFRFEPLADIVRLANGGTLTHFPLQHPGGSLGFRLDWPGHSLAYVTDTTAAADAAYVEKIRGVDLLLHEAYFADDANNLPESPATARCRSRRSGRRRRVGRLVLVHIDPQIDRRQPVRSRRRPPRVSKHRNRHRLHGSRILNYSASQLFALSLAISRLQHSSIAVVLDFDRSAAASRT